jgi:hypothetical protein
MGLQLAHAPSFQFIGLLDLSFDQLGTMALRRISILWIRLPGHPGRPLADRSRGTDVPVRIFLIHFFNPRGICDP